MRRLAVLLVLFIIVFSGTCCTLHKIQEARRPSILLSEPMRKHIWIDSSFSEEEKDQIITAYQTIECSTNYSLVQFEFTRNATVGDYYRMKIRPSIVVINSDSSDPRIKASDKRLAKDGKHTAGLYLSQEEIPTVLLPKDRLNKKSFYRVAVHEAIHSSFNILTHSESKEAIMFYALDETSAQDMSEDDLKYICDVYQCDSEYFKLCVGE